MIGALSSVDILYKEEMKWSYNLINILFLI